MINGIFVGACLPFTFFVSWNAVVSTSLERSMSVWLTSSLTPTSDGRLENSRCMFQISRHRQVIYHPPTPQRGLQFVFPHPMLELHVDLRGVEISCCTRRRQWLDLNIGWSSDYLWTKGLKSHFIKTAATIRKTIKYRFGIAWLHRRTRISVSFAPTIV